jgi:hypothetical protein
LESSRIASILEGPRAAAGERDVATLAMRQLLLGRLRTDEGKIGGPASILNRITLNKQRIHTPHEAEF